jgi:hypothetical protein
MSGNASLDPANLIDSLVGVIDDLRGDLNAAFGTRPFRCFTVMRSWTGQEQGEGDYSDVVNELIPAPRVRFWDGYKWVMTPLGTHEDGTIRIDEVSLTYTYDDLSPQGLRLNQQFFYVLAEANGQGQANRYLKQSKPPFVDREKTIGWICDLMDCNGPAQNIPELPL